jgi:hypothetical protein
MDEKERLPQVLEVYIRAGDEAGRENTSLI